MSVYVALQHPVALAKQHCACPAALKKAALAVQIFHDEDDELQEAEVENVLALQGADEDDTDSDGSDVVDRSDSDASDEASDADDE